MARITVEDCVRKVPNRFELVVLAAERVREIMAGGAILVKRDKDKNPVIALREIALGLVSQEHLIEGLIKGQQLHASFEEEDEEEILDIIEEEQNWVTQPESTEMQEEILEDDLCLIEPSSEE